MQQTGELLLKQIDRAGYLLSKLGISDKLNRHNCIAFVITENQRIKGEVNRLQLKIGLQKIKLKKTKKTLSGLLDSLSKKPPAPLEKPLK